MKRYDAGHDSGMSPGRRRHSMPHSRLLLAGMLGFSLALGSLVHAPLVQAQDPLVQDPLAQNPLVQDPLIDEQLEDQGVVANVLSRLLTTPTTRISIGAIEGALSTSAVIHDITISDPDGVWLTLDRAEINWSLTALLRRRLQVSDLTLGELKISRRPLPTERPEEVAEGPVFPELPVAVVVENFTLDRLVLEEPVLGTAAELTASGSAELVSPEEGLMLAFAARRTDAEGVLDIDVRYVPDTNVLTLDFALDEPEGGIVARLLDVPGLPPVQLAITGDAPLDAFAADLAFQAGPDIGAQGIATVDRGPDAYRVDLDVAAQIAGLMPEAVAPVFAGTTQLVGNAAYFDDGSLALDQLRLAAPAAQLVLSGTMDAERRLAMSLTGTTVPTADGVTRVGDVEVAAFDVDVAVEGLLNAPQIAGRIDASGLSMPAGTVEVLSTQVDFGPDAATPDAAVPEGAIVAQRFRFDVSANATGVVPTDPDLAAAIGDSVDLVARGLTEMGGATTVEQAQIATPTMNATYAGVIDRRSTDGVLEAEIPTLAPMAGLTGFALEGAAVLSARITGDPLVEDYRADVEGVITEFASGQDALDGLFGPQVSVAGGLRSMRDGFAFEGFRIEGENLDLTTDGAAGTESADLTLNAIVPRLEALHDQIDAGQARIEARLTGSLERPNATATAALENVTTMGRPIPRMQVQVEALDILDALDASMTLDGEVGENLATGGFRLRAIDEGWLLDPLDITIGSVVLAGNLQVGPDLLTQGEVSLQAGDLDDLSPLLLMDLGGSFEALATLDVEDGGQNAVVRINGAELRVEEVLLQNFRIDATGRDVVEQPRIDGLAEAGMLLVAGQTFTDIRITAEGTPEATDFSLSAVGDGAIFETDGRIMPALPGDPLPRLDLSDINVRPVEQ